jgi:excisionase family DNA binding protein
MKRCLLTIDEVAAILRLDKDEVIGLLDRRELDAVDLPRGIVRVRPTDLQAFLRVRRRLFTTGRASA